jgi:hypothetical protein
MLIFVRPIAMAALGIALFFSPSSLTAQQTPPLVAVYGIASSTCGDLLRSDTASAGYSYFRTWTMGYTTGRNSALTRGGNVLGSVQAQIDDFLLLLRRRCEAVPMSPLFRTLEALLDSIGPVDQAGKPYPRRPDR